MRRATSSILLVAVSVVLSLAAVEIVLRVMGVGFPQFYGMDAHLGGVLRPNVSGWFKSEGRSYVEINTAGMHDREHTPEKPAGVYRIAVLGDSMTEAMQVARDRNFCSVLESRLKGCSRLGGKTPEVLNFGVSGYGTAQELIMLRDRVWQYHPDLVLLAMFPGNDLRNNNEALNKDIYCPYYTLDNGQLRLQYPPPTPTGGLRTVRDWLTDHSRLMQLVAFIRRVRHTQGKDVMVQKGTDPRLAGEAGVDDATFAPPQTDDWRQAWAVTEALLVEMRNEVRGHGAEFAVALIPSGIQDYPEASVRQAYLSRPGVQDLSYAHERLAQFLAAQNVSVIPLEAAMRSYAEAHHATLHGFSNTVAGFGHMNEAGHQVVGDLLAAGICQK